MLRKITHEVEPRMSSMMRLWNALDLGVETNKRQLGQIVLSSVCTRLTMYECMFLPFGIPTISEVDNAHEAAGDLLSMVIKF